MRSPATLRCLLLLGMLWADQACGGSSFLSPEHQKVQQRKESKKPPAKLQPRALEGWLRPEDSPAEGAEDELSLPPLMLDSSCRARHQHSQAPGKSLQDILWEEAHGESPDQSPRLSGHPDSRL